MELDCPNCGSVNAFPNRRRDHPVQEGWIQIFIKCTTCPYERVIREGPQEIIELELDIEKLKGKQAASVNLSHVIANREHRLKALRAQHGFWG